MSFCIKEYCGSTIENKNYSTINDNKLSLCENTLSKEYKEKFFTIIESIHVGPTRNYTWYTEEALIDSIPSWTSPYKRPVILHHNETDGKIVGRIENVNFIKNSIKSNSPALSFETTIGDNKAIEDVKNEILSTTSIGVIVHKAHCSICGQEITSIDEEDKMSCGHTKGNMYDNEICYLVIDKMEGKEISFVVVPSDIYSGVMKYYYKKVGSEKVTDIKEGYSKMTIQNKEGMATDEEVKNDASKVKETENTEKKEEEKETKEENTSNNNNEDLIKEMESLKAKNGELTTSLNETQKKLEAINKQIEKLTTDLGSEKLLKEAAEKEVDNLKAEAKEFLTTYYLDIRESMNKPVILKESLQKRSVESIKDSIADLKEEMKKSNTITKTEDPTLKKLEVKEKEEKSKQTINLKEGLSKAVSSLF